MDKSITAWRFWNLSEVNNVPTLSSVAYGSFSWSKGLLKAECQIGDEKHDYLESIPAKGCSCGIYSYKTIKDLFDDVHTGDTVIIGEIEIGGKVWEHTYGWRSEYGQISKIWYVPDYKKKYNLPAVGSYTHPPVITGRFKRTVTETIKVRNQINMFSGEKVAKAYDCDLFDATDVLDEYGYAPTLETVEVKEHVECIQTVSPTFRAGFMR